MFYERISDTDTSQNTFYLKKGGHLVVQAANLYAMFQGYDGGPRLDNGIGIYGYGRMTAREDPLTPDAAQVARPEGLILDRNGKRGSLAGQGIRGLDVILRGNILVMPDEEAEAILDEFKESPRACSWPPSQVPAENLFRYVAGMRLSEVSHLLGADDYGQYPSFSVDGCATFSEHESGARLTYVNLAGGYSIGLPAMPEGSYAPAAELQTAGRQLVTSV